MNKYTFCFCLFLSMAMLITTSSIYVRYSVHSNPTSQSYYGDHNKSEATGAELDRKFSRNRKLLVNGRDIIIFQQQDPTPGIPHWVVQIVNACLSSCGPSDIHFKCGWFASARKVMSDKFVRLAYDDCLVNGGKAMESGQICRDAPERTHQPKKLLLIKPKGLLRKINV